MCNSLPNRLTITGRLRLELPVRALPFHNPMVLWGCEDSDLPINYGYNAKDLFFEFEVPTNVNQMCFCKYQLAVLVWIKDYLLQCLHSISTMPGCSETDENGERKMVAQLRCSVIIWYQISLVFGVRLALRLQYEARALWTPPSGPAQTCEVSWVDWKNKAKLVRLNYWNSKYEHCLHCHLIGFPASNCIHIFVSLQRDQLSIEANVHQCNLRSLPQKSNIDIGLHLLHTNSH